MPACDRWIHTTCLCFGLDCDEQARSHFRYNYSIYQVEYSSNLLFRVGSQMEQVFDAVVNRTHAHLDVPETADPVGAKTRPHSDRASGTPALDIMIEKPRYNLTWLKVHFDQNTSSAWTRPSCPKSEPNIIWSTRRRR